LGLKNVFTRHYSGNSLKHKAGVNEGGSLRNEFSTELLAGWAPMNEAPEGNYDKKVKNEDDKTLSHVGQSFVNIF